MDLMRKRCDFDSGNEEHTCELSGEPCPVKGRKEKCPIPAEEKKEEADEPFTEKDHRQF